ncbi:hypothetical protein K3G63_06980 [Hymenobacter sp. HSC-4F20]|uniref:AsmA-like C-terminal region-containing protein n=1 Tax=Hymenobacter sp. HSC-4F20 TaxID=2864135 RepID=UPI001C72FBE6|nr:AsmA-like C-terminal region-containing protein [Hymenobacter sp. HSC-4F20]MBX0290175.1 hypothetical protein [Hymenobacter sp. HSC-4F20]
MKRPSVLRLLAFTVLALLIAGVTGAWLVGTRWGQRQLEHLIRQRLAQQSDLVLAPFDVRISLLPDFPHLTASLRHLVLTDTSYHRAVPVLRVGQADMRLELGQAWRGQFRVSHLTLRNVEFQQFTDSRGHDWGLRGKGPRNTTPTPPPDFDLDSLVVFNLRVLDHNELHRSGFSAYVRLGRLRAQVRRGQAHVGGHLQGQLEFLRSGRGNLFEQEPIQALIRYQYDFRRRQGTFLQTKATLNGDTVLVSGTHRGAAPGEPRGTYLNLHFRGNQPLLEVLHVALPPSLDRFLAGARSPSHARIAYTIRGLSGPTTRPRTVLRFALHNAQVRWADSTRRIRRWDARGVFDNGRSHSPRTTSLVFERCRLYSEAGELDAALAVRDFTRPRLHGHVRGRTELQTLAAVVAPHLWRARSGRASLNLDLNGTLPEIPDRTTRRTLHPDSLLPPIAARGTVELEQAAFDIPSRQATMRNLTVRVRLLDSLWVLENLTGQLNRMRVQANATTTHLLAYFSGQHPTTSIAGTFTVDDLALGELRRLLAPPGGRAVKSHPQASRPGYTRNQELASRALNLLPPGLRLNVRLRCGRLVLAADTLYQLAATVRHNGHLVRLHQLQGQVWGGQITGAISWPTDTLNLQPVAARLAVHFPLLRYDQLLARLTQPSRKGPTAPTDATLREVLLAANGQATATIDRLVLPGSDYLSTVRLLIDKKGPVFLIPALTFATKAGGTGRISATAQLAGTHLTHARADLDLRYQTLDVQHLLQLLAALSTVPPSTSEVGPRARKSAGSPSPFLDGTITGRVHVRAQEVQYGALQGQQFQLRSQLLAGQARVEECSMQAFGGTLRLRGTMQTNAGSGHHPLHAQLQLRAIQLPELFKLATALGFEVLGPENIRGTMQCGADVHTDLDNSFLPQLAVTRAFLRTDLRELELMDVEAVTQALKMLSEKRTSHLYFEPVQPRFVLDGSRLLIPHLGLSSNLTDMTISGEYYLTGKADLYVGLSPLQALLGNNRKRIARIQSGEAAERPNRGLLYVNLQREPGSRYKVRLFQKQEQQAQQRALQQQYQHLLQRQPLDTTLRLLQ